MDPSRKFRSLFYEREKSFVFVEFRGARRVILESPSSANAYPWHSSLLLLAEALPPQTEESLFKDNGGFALRARTRNRRDAHELAYNRIRCTCAQRVIHFNNVLSVSPSLPSPPSPSHRSPRISLLDKRFVRELITCYTLRRVENVSF